MAKFSVKKPLTVFVVVLAVVVLGAVCMGVGFITGADTARIYSVLDDKYSLTLYSDYITQALIPAFQEAGVF